MSATRPYRAHLIAGGFPPGAAAGHDHDHARLVLLQLLAERAMPASVSGDFSDIEKWLPLARLLVTYVAGPYPNAGQCRVIEDWITTGGHWLGLHGTAGGRAERVEGQRQRRTVKTDHHALLGGMFLTHPPLCRFHVDVRDTVHPLTRGLGTGFDVEDEPYFVELQAPADTRILLTADYGSAAVSNAFGTLYPADTSLLANGRTRAIGYTKPLGKGAVTYIALGHCHSPASRPGRPEDPIPPLVRGAWAHPAFLTLLANAIDWDVTTT